MIPVNQTVFGGRKGNCFSACIAALLELPIEEVPTFCENRETWLADLQAWLRPRGYFYLDIKFASDGARADLLPVFGYHVISGDGERGCRHSVIGLAGEMIHDPLPNGTGLIANETIEYGFLIPLDPMTGCCKPGDDSYAGRTVAELGAGC